MFEETIKKFEVQTVGPTGTSGFRICFAQGIQGIPFFRLIFYTDTFLFQPFFFTERSTPTHFRPFFYADAITVTHISPFFKADIIAGLQIQPIFVNQCFWTCRTLEFFIAIQKKAKAEYKCENFELSVISLKNTSFEILFFK